MVEHPDSVRTGVNRRSLVVTGELVNGTFTTDQPMGTTPTLTITLSSSTGEPVKKFMLEDVQYYLDPTNAQTYQLFLLEDATADDVQQLTDIVFASPAAQADITMYKYSRGGLGTYTAAGGWVAEVVQYKLPKIVELATPNTLYFMLDWTAAPGATTGFIKIRGRLLK